MMIVHDRGKMKWVSLMLPEHVELLENVFAERTHRPILDEQKRAEIDQKLKYSIHHQMYVMITYYKNNEYITLHGKIKRINQWKGYIVLSNEQGDFVPLTDIIDIMMYE